jgi:hydroxymethylbilane synthase
MAFKLKIGSRPSRLALAQVEIVRARLAEVIPDLDAEIIAIKTSGDKMTTASLARVGGKGLFIRELEQALLERKIDVAVHSMKDLPAILPPEFRLAAIPEREDTRDAAVIRGGRSIAELPRGARVGTSSSRRRFQALRVNPGLEISPLRGNVDTRLQSVTDGKLDAIIVAVAGLKRLGRTDVAFAPLDEHQFIPAGGQGALAIETLIEIDGEIARALAALDNPRARYETTAERAFLATLGASCVTPVGIKATVSGSSISLRAMLFSNDGAHEMSDEIEEPIDATLPPAAAQSLGVKLGERMLANGADRLVADG